MVRYVERGGEQVPRHPSLQTKVSLQGYVLNGQRSHLQALVDRCLNEPAGGQVSYHVPVDRMLLVFAHLGRVASLDAEQQHRGWMPELDVSVWVPVVSWHDGRPHLAWFLPYVFVDQPNALLAGREIWGFPKVLAQTSFAGPLPQGGPLTVAAPGVARFDPAAEVAWCPVFSVRRTDVAAPAPAPDLGLTLDWLGLFHPAGSLVFLKQFRDVADPTQACYQAIIEAPVVWTDWRGGALLTGDWEFDLLDLASYPLAADLGLRIGPQPARLPFWVAGDFRVDLGREVWRA